MDAADVKCQCMVPVQSRAWKTKRTLECAISDILFPVDNPVKLTGIYMKQTIMTDPTLGAPPATSATLNLIENRMHDGYVLDEVWEGWPPTRSASYHLQDLVCPGGHDSLPAILHNDECIKHLAPWVGLQCGRNSACPPR